MLRRESKLSNLLVKLSKVWEFKKYNPVHLAKLSKLYSKQSKTTQLIEEATSVVG